MVQNVRRPRKGKDQARAGVSKSSVSKKQKEEHQNSRSRFVLLQDKPGVIDLEEEEPGMAVDMAIDHS